MPRPNTKGRGQMAILEGYLSEAELAKQLNKTERTLQIWRQRREGPPWTKVGKSVFYYTDTVLAWLKAQEQHPVRQPKRIA
jgi:hypothetical protein